MALPTTRVAVMGPAGKDFVYKDELRAVRAEAQAMLAERLGELKASGTLDEASRASAEREVGDWLKAKEAEFNQRYERELMNPKEALSLGSISEIVQPERLRASLAHNLQFFLSHYTPGPMQGVQREFH